MSPYTSTQGISFEKNYLSVYALSSVLVLQNPFSLTRLLKLLFTSLKNLNVLFFKITCMYSYIFAQMCIIADYRYEL